VMLSEGLWRDRFGANPSVIGRGITLDGRNVTVVGVSPRGVPFSGGCDVWTSLVLDTSQYSANVHRALARLKPDVTLEQAQAEMDAIISGSPRRSLPPHSGKWGVSLVSLQEHIVGGARSLLFVFLGVGRIRSVDRVRQCCQSALGPGSGAAKGDSNPRCVGAGRARIVRHFLTESLVLALAGGVLGLLLAVWGLGLLIALMPPDLVPRVGEIGLDVRVLGFNFALSLLTGVVFGLVPAWQASRTQGNETLKEGGRGQSSGVRHRLLRQALVAAEIAVSIVLLIGAGLMLKSLPGCAK